MESFSRRNGWLIEPRPRVGTRVLPRDQWNLMDRQVIDWHVADPGFLLDRLELRLMVEPGAAHLAAERATEEQIATLGRPMAAWPNSSSSSSGGSWKRAWRTPWRAARMPREVSEPHFPARSGPFRGGRAPADQSFPGT
ncbi:MAG TPA: hypothetical protein VNO21_16730 [Polyangiaceae bacterium]|nr:hypothetical protein [Polyangiaceae bacterium]